MTSVKERVAALKFAEKLCVRPPALGVLTRTVRSSSLWSGLIVHLRSSVKVKRRRLHLKSHGDSFLGSEAVDTLADHLAHLKGLQDGRVTRDKVACVCQALLDCKVFEAVGTKVLGKAKRADRFEDSKSALYRFICSPIPSVDELERGVLSQGIQSFFGNVPSDRHGEPVSPQTVPFRLCSPEKSDHLPSPTNARLLEIPFRASQSQESREKWSLSPSRVHTDSPLPQSLVNEVWREQTTLRLLKLVELPLLEGVLQCSRSPPPHQLAHGNPDLIYSSNHLDRQILKAFRDCHDDEWLCAALDCLDFLPDQPVVELSRELPRCFPHDQDGPVPTAAVDEGGLIQCKLLAYGTLAEHYSHADRSPLLPECLTDVYTAVIDLLVNAKLDQALEALQLCLKLLPQSRREELRRLLNFMCLAAEPQGTRLDKEMENRFAVKRSFSRAIVHSRALSKENEDLLVVFMLSNRQDIFKIPGALHKVVSDKLDNMAREIQPDVTGPMLVQHVSCCVDSAKLTTDKELRALLDGIYLDPKISAKGKKRLLRQFNQAHPEVFHQYFGDSALNVL